ncbi:MAG: hypothetical protein P1U74_08640 [Legionellaceae bacterium]|nr:hypothetical protein [Legionellaceae bacterium]
MPHLNRFIFNPDEDLSRLPGRSAQNGLLFFAHKVMREEFNPDHPKYQSGHFLKKITCGNYDSRRQIASSEVAFQEFLRLMIPHQPKARLVTDDDDLVFIQSKEVPNSRPLITLPAISARYYGTKYGLKGLGELDFYLNSVLLDIDQSERNYVVDDNNMIHRIDFGLTSCVYMRSFQYTNRSLFTTEEILANPSYQLERNRALLKFLILPTSLLKAFFSYHTSRNLENTVSCLLKTQTFMRLALRTEDEFVDLLFPGFKSYLKSDQAIVDGFNFQDHLLNFKLKGKLSLRSLCPEINPSLVMQRYAFIIRDQTSKRLRARDWFPGESEESCSPRI